MREKGTKYKHLVRDLLMIVSIVFVGMVYFGNQRASADENPVDLNGLHTTIWYTANGNNTPLFSLASSDGVSQSLDTMNLDKYKDLIVHYTAKNETGSTQSVEPSLTLPLFYGDLSENDGIVPGLTFDTSRASELTTSVEGNESGDKFNTYYKGSGDYTDQLPSTPLQVIWMAKELWTYTSLANNATVSISVPLKPTQEYDWANPSKLPLAVVSDMFYYSNSIQGYQSRAVWLRLYRSLVVQDFQTADYNTLVGTAKRNGIVKLFKDFAGDKTQANPQNMLPVEVTDHTQATVDSITPTDTAGEYTVTYTFDGVTKSVTATTVDKSYIDAKNFTVGYGSDWASQEFNGLTTHKDANGNGVTPLSKDVTVSIKLNGQAVGKVDTSKAGSVYDVTYTAGGASKTIQVTVGPQGNTPSNNGGGSSSNTTPNTTNNGNSTNNPVGNGNFNNGSTTTQPAVPNYAAKEGTAVYATKGIYLYKNANFKKSQRIAKYPKAKRVNRPMFVVTGYARSSNGTLRYKVRDVNHGKKTANKVGYITASRKYVVNVYYKTMPKNKQITVISKKGVHAYKNVNLTGKAKTYKNGKHLQVKKIVKHNLTTRYQLSNGYYVTGNKKLVIQGNY
ncbi:hypothetical protein LRA02_20090 [Lentilactobacillus rapi]|uniref:DUF5776 domain-containing protein n=2 Tax=Lentilactobacillus rapi TaxID=481723 RepID=A0A512PPM6_9LACO|nr:hypothetical protein LRA02_20090 [Lentilactobacillus rapi]